MNGMNGGIPDLGALKAGPRDILVPEALYWFRLSDGTELKARLKYAIRDLVPAMIHTESGMFGNPNHIYIEVEWMAGKDAVGELAKANDHLWVNFAHVMAWRILDKNPKKEVMA